MKVYKMLIIIGMAAILVAGTATATESIQFPGTAKFLPVQPQPAEVILDELDEDSTLYSEDFESDDHGWEAFDYTTTPARWHVDPWNALDDGVSWWCGEHRYVDNDSVWGYDNAWLQYLDSPSLDFTDAGDDLVLNFQMQYGSEDGDPANEDYDGWDGGTVFITTDVGENWEVIADPSHDYNAESLYSFGVTHELGIGIAGWRDVSDGWVECEYDLSDYAGEADVMVRFAFASENGRNTEENEDWFGFMIDDIIIEDTDNTYLENDAEDIADPEDFTPLDQVGADIAWELQTEEYHSENHAWRLESGLDIVSMLVSPEIPTIDGWRHFLVYWVYCDWEDSDGNGDNTLEDYFTIEISTDGGSQWVQIFYDYAFNGSETGWEERDSAMVAGTYGELEIPTDYIGEDIRLRFRAMSDGDEDGGTGSGIHIDDVSVIANSGFEHDIGVEYVTIPFPTTVGSVVPAWTQIRNFGNNTETSVRAAWFLGNTPYLFVEDVTIAPDDSVRDWLDNDEDDNLDGWMPSSPGAFEIYVQCILTNGDDFTDNNISATYPIDVLAEGNFEYGYDDRLPSLFYRAFEAGEGPATYFDDFDFETIGSFMPETVRVQWNGDFDGGEFDVRLHIMSDSEGAPNEDIFTEVYTVLSEETYTNWHEIDISDEEISLDEPFWVWFELVEEEDQPRPHIIFSTSELGTEHHYRYDGTDVGAPQGDWMIRIVGGHEFSGKAENISTLPGDFVLYPAYPNPFNPSVSLKYDVPISSLVKINIYDLLGREVAQLVNTVSTPGSHSVNWNAAGLASGLYFAKMEANGKVFNRKLMLLK
ncbi:MAG: T9SS type A sorting domain-containing protein [Candidatus Electryonea clarkiae]|nr:T9SS type A sorting domain-containing protein [Candidatus Electryonea clarkiae]MDP8288347.1 T9SS type A sorting domain-containing protein [Candidatus Electryonea clarkiae]